jgi:adenylate cyclase class 2
MPTEYEAKFLKIDKAQLQKTLKRLGAKLIHPERLMRRAIFDRLAYPQIKPYDYVRVRDEGHLVRLSTKIHARKGGKISDQKELETTIGNFDTALKILAILGYKPIRYQETLRETWRYQGTEITIDTWPGLEPLTEIEACSEKQVKQVSETLGFNWNQKVITSITEVFANKYHLTEAQTLEKLSSITFNHNPFRDPDT